MTTSTREILFVLGGARSGTTYVNGILDKWFDYGMGPEGAFVDSFYRRRHRYGDLAQDAALRALVDDLCQCDMLTIMRSKWAPDVRRDVTARQILDRVEERSFSGVLYALFAAVADVQGKSRVGNKWPDYWRHLDSLDSMFGARARYLFVLRDGRDVALSTMKLPWGEKTSYACARNWAQCVESVRRFEVARPDARVLTVRYEDLLADPDAAFVQLSEFLCVEVDPATRAAFVQSALENPMRNNVSKWRQAMSIRDQRMYEAVAGDALTESGYELVHRPPPPSRLAHLYYRGLEIVRKVIWTLRFRFRRMRQS
jgi:hypothetical protein